MSKKREVDAKAGKAMAGLAVLVAAVAGFGWWRSRVAQAHGEVCKLIEESVYRGFKYQIKECPVGSSHAYLGIVPIQQVGSINITADQGEMLVTIDEARKYVQRLIDAKLGPQLQAIFVGSQR